MTRKELIKKLAEWIDTEPIAETIVDALMEGTKIVPPLGDCQCVWLDILQYLHDNIRRSAAYVLK